jgi:hypothetical protein
MTFDPQTVHTTETIAYVALALLFIGIAVVIFMAWKKKGE